MTIGRSESCDISIPEDNNLSNIHAEVSRSPRGFTVQDLESTNGTLVNRAPIMGETALHHLDILQVGMTSLRFEDIGFVTIPGQESPEATQKAKERPKFLLGLVAGLAIWVAFAFGSAWLRQRTADRKETEKILSGQATTPRMSLFQAAVLNDVPQITAHERLGTDLDQRDTNGFTALHLAAFKGNAEAVRALVEGGADVNAKATNGSTPLQSARMAGHSALVRYLRSKGGS